LNVSININKIGAELTLAGALAFTALGMGAGIASADQPLPSTPGMTWKLDHGHGHGGDWGGDGGGGWNGGGWDGGGWNGGWNGWNGGYGGGCGVGYWVPPAVAQWVPPAAWGC
jgi:hypothetical protein